MDFRKSVARAVWAVVAVAALAATQSSALAQSAPAWNRVAGTTLNLGLAGPATGPVQAVWYSAAGDRLFARTASGRVFETSDFQQWKLNASDSVPEAALTPPAIPSLERPGAGLQIATRGARRYSVTRGTIYGSEGGLDGRSGWLNLTGFNGRSIIGDGFTALAVSPADPLDITASNQSGVWRSLDGGLSWQSLNEGLPNLPAHRLAGQRTILLSDGANLAAVTAGTWKPIEGAASEAVLRAGIAARSGIATTAAVQVGLVLYAGTASGSLLASPDGGSSWTPWAVPAATDSVERIWSDAANPSTALAASGTRLFRTTNAGRFWDDVTGPPGSGMTLGKIHGIAADTPAGIVYVAADRGLFSGKLSLTAADLSSVAWTPVAGDLPISRAWDVRLNMDGTLTVLLDGFGVYETQAPHRLSAPRIVNAADMTERAAAPGSVITVLGVRLNQARSGQSLYPVLLASDQSSQLQVPFDVAPGTFLLALEGDGGRWVAPLNVKETAPAIFVDAEGTPFIQDAETQLSIDAGTPLRAGSVVQILATGLGRVTPEWQTNVPAPVDSPPVVRALVTAFLDGRPVRVIRATLAPGFIGNYLVELEIPAFVNRGVSELRIVANGEESNRVKLYLEPNPPGQLR